MSSAQKLRTAALNVTRIRDRETVEIKSWSRRGPYLRTYYQACPTLEKNAVGVGQENGKKTTTLFLFSDN